METSNQDLLLGQEIQARDCFRPQTMCLLARRDIPDADGLVIRSGDETISLEDEGGTEVGMTTEESNRLG